MKWIYLLAGLAFYIKMLWLADPASVMKSQEIVAAIVEDTGIPNTVSGIIFRNRLYDTIFEVVVFTLSIMGVRYLLANEQPIATVRRLEDEPSIVLAQLGATISALICIELMLRGHLSPGGGFAAGVAGGTAIGLVAIVSPADWMEGVYKKWQASKLEKLSVLVFIIMAVATLGGWALPSGEFGALLSGGSIPLLNALVALKVALGSWAAILLFIRYRGLL